VVRAARDALLKLQAAVDGRISRGEALDAAAVLESRLRTFDEAMTQLKEAE